MNQAAKTVVAVIVTLVWGVNFIAPLFRPDYAPSPDLNVAFMAIIGYLVGSHRRRKKAVGRAETREIEAEDEYEEDE